MDGDGSLHLLTPTLPLMPTSILTCGNKKQPTTTTTCLYSWASKKGVEEGKGMLQRQEGRETVGGRPQRVKTLLTGRWPFLRTDAAFSRSPSAARPKGHLSGRQNSGAHATSTESTTDNSSPWHWTSYKLHPPPYLTGALSVPAKNTRQQVSQTQE